jgi:hypothetical protein
MWRWVFPKLTRWFDADWESTLLIILIIGYCYESYFPISSLSDSIARLSFRISDLFGMV